MVHSASLLLLLGSATAFAPAGRPALTAQRSVRANIWPFNKKANVEEKKAPEPAVASKGVSVSVATSVPSSSKVSMSTKAKGTYSRMPGALSVDLSSDSSLETVMQGNKNWIADCTKQDPEFFTRFTQGQTPQILWIGCSDSRVPASKVTGLDVGDVFVTRNVANVVSGSRPCNYSTLNAPGCLALRLHTYALLCPDSSSVRFLTK